MRRTLPADGAIPGYRVERLLGRGGFGTVLQAVCERTGARAAVKVARPDVPGAGAQLAREAGVLSAIGGGGAAPALLASGTAEGGLPFIVLELVEGVSLADRMAPGARAVSLAEAEAISGALLDAIERVHRSGFAHGDLKPQNVVIQRAPPHEARLLDFGLAEPLADAGAARRPPAGTAGYTSPEQCEGRCPDARSDVYAAGVLLFELFTGRKPFVGPAPEVRHAHVHVRPPRPSSLAGVTPAVDHVILRCLEKRPDDRFASASAAKVALAAALASSRGPTPATVASDALPGGSRRRVGVLFLQSRSDPVAMQATAASVGAVVGHAGPGRFALVFDPGAREHPVRVALAAGRSLLGSGLATRAIVDLVTVIVQPRRGGPDWYVSAAFSRCDAYPRDGDPDGPLVTPRAAEVLTDERFSGATARDGLLACVDGPGARAPAGPHPAPPAPLVGRDGVVGELLELATSALRGAAPTLAAVLGDVGVGKSRVLAALAERVAASLPDVDVWHLRAVDGADGGAGGLLPALLRTALGLGPRDDRGDGGRSAITGALPEELREAWPAVALALGWLAPDAPELRSQAAAPGALARLAVRAAGVAMQRRAAARPLCVLVDDAHLAGGGALDALEHAALSEAAGAIFACAVARPGFASARPQWGERAARSRTLRLGALDRASASELCRRLLLPVESAPARAIEILVERAKCVPLLLVELVQSLRRDGLVRRHAQGGSYYLATDQLERVPDMAVVDWLADRALRDIPRELAAHAQLAALLGDETSPAEVAGVLAELEAAGLGSAFPLDGRAATGRLVALGVLAERADGNSSYRLPLVRDGVSRSTSEPMRRAVHEAACRFYAREDSSPAAERLPRLLRHAEESGRRRLAAELALRLAEDARARHAYLAAEALYTRALALQDDSSTRERLVALRGRGLMRYRLVRHEDSVHDLEMARSVACALGDRAAELDCLLDEATALDWMSDYATSRRRYEAAAALAGDAQPAQWARLELARGRSHFREAEWAEAAAALETAAAIAQEVGDEGYETLVVSLLMLGTTLPSLGRAALAQDALARATQLAEGCGDDLHVVAACLNERNVWVARGDLAAAVRSQQRAVRVARELGVVLLEYFGEYNAAELFYQAGDLDAARPHANRAMEVERRHPEIAPTPIARLLEARMLLLAGDLTEARERLGAIRGELARAQAEGWRGAELKPNDEVLVAVVDLATRAATDGEWDRLLSASRRASVEQEAIEVVEMRGRAALRAGQPELAVRALEQALDLAQRTPNFLAPRVRQALATARGAAAHVGAGAGVEPTPAPPRRQGGPLGREGSA